MNSKEKILKKNNLTGFTAATRFVAFLTIFLVYDCSKKKNDNTVLVAGLAIASQSTNTGTTPFQSEAAIAGYAVPNVPVRGVSSITLSDSSTSLDVKNQLGSATNYDSEKLRMLKYNSSLSSSTDTTRASFLFNATSGIVSYVFSLNPTEIGVSTFTVQLSINGQSSEVNFSSVSGVQTTNRMVLNNGRNYAWITISSGGSVITRSDVYRIDSTVASTPLRTELFWNGTGDIDLIVDDGTGGRKVYWLVKTNTSPGFNIALDVDNTVAYGPENIRVFTTPSGSNYRFFANYFSGSNSLTATAKVYTGTTLIDTKTLSFTTSDVSTSNSFDSKSKLIGTYTVTGTTAVSASISAP